GGGYPRSADGQGWAVRRIVWDPGSGVSVSGTTAPYGRGFHEKAHPCQALVLSFGRVTAKGDPRPKKAQNAAAPFLFLLERFFGRGTDNGDPRPTGRRR